MERLATALVGRYQVQRELGQGGMATVYLAHDLRHQRKVALKVLRPELAAVIGAERFLHEITTTANLQHPHILGLHDSGQIDGTVFYVMPFVEGESLRDRLTREKQLPVDEAVRIAREVAGALDYAHRHGVIHRDIKPENILLHDGSALVADFGIALAASKTGGARMTETGMSLGTPHYMSPEQAMGDRSLDARTDVYALGCVLYEMLAGEPPFTGPTPQAIVAKVLTDDPRPLSQLRRSVPPGVEEAVAKALEKLPADRFAGTAAFADALGFDGRSGIRPAVRAGSRRALPLPLMAAAAVAIALAGFLIGRLLPDNGAVSAVSFGSATQVTFEPGLEVHPAISPDGRSVAYGAGSAMRLKLFVRPITGGRPIPLTTDTSFSESNPAWSPDGSRVLFLSRGGAFSAPASGGAARQELPAHSAGISWAAWAPDGRRIGYTAEDTLFVRDDQGNVNRIGIMNSPSLCAWSPNGAMIACASGNVYYAGVGGVFGNTSPGWIVVIQISSGAKRTLTDSTTLNHSPVWSPDGRKLYFISNRHGPRDIYVQAVTRDGAPSGPVERLTTGLGAQSISLSRDGLRLAWSAFVSTANVWSVELPRPGAPPVSVREAVQVTFGNQIIEDMRVSPDDKWLYYDSNQSGNADIYRMPLPRGEPERLTTDPADEFSPDVSSDGREVAFHSWRSGSRDLYVMPLDGGPTRQVTSTPLQEIGPRWSPDGSRLSFGELSVVGGVGVVERGSDGGWRAPVKRWDRGVPSGWSPDGRLLVFSETPAPTQVGLGVIPFDSGPPRMLITPTPGGAVVDVADWSDDGRTIYYKGRDDAGRTGFWAIPAAGGVPRQVVRFDDPTRPSSRNTAHVKGNRAYFTIEDQRSDVWVMDIESRKR